MKAQLVIKGVRQATAMPLCIIAVACSSQPRFF